MDEEKFIPLRFAMNRTVDRAFCQSCRCWHWLDAWPHPPLPVPVIGEVRYWEHDGAPAIVVAVSDTEVELVGGYRIPIAVFRTSFIMSPDEVLGPSNPTKKRAT
jgi:hypothetical protein